MNKCLVSEYFASFQGEGLFAGCRQFFIRFAGCNVPRCRYCDTKEPKEPLCLSVDELVRVTIEHTAKEGIDAVSLTGGEPLMQSDFLIEFLDGLSREAKMTIFLETNATLPSEMSRLAPLIDRVSADFKLSSVTRGPSFSDQHTKFFRILERENVPYFVKAVVDKRVDREEFESMCSILAAESPGKALIIQPVMKGKRPQISSRTLEELYNVARAHALQARILPQIHKILNFR